MSILMLPIHGISKPFLIKILRNIISTLSIRVFQDAHTHERLNANSKDVFEPGPWYEVINKYFQFKVVLVQNVRLFFKQHYIPELRSGRLQRLQDLQPKRVTVNITSPLYSLKDSAINVILRCLPVNSNRINQAIYELEIPRQLQEELLLMRDTRN